jgi:hypothetical protein
MAKKTFLIDVDLATNELQNATIQNLASPPSGLTSSDGGRTYFDTTKHLFGIWSGTKWNYLDDIPVVDFTPYLKHDGSVPMSANFNVNSNKIINLSTPTANTDATNKSYVDAKVSTVPVGDVIGPATATNNNVAIFDTTTGKKIKDSGFTINANVPAGAVFDPTNLANSPSASDIELTSSTGSDTIIPSATGSKAGVMTAADKTKLDSVSNGAEPNIATELSKVTSSTNVSIVSSTGSVGGVSIGASSSSVAGVMTAAQYTKLLGIATGATVQIQSDWTQTNNGLKDYIKNKPTHLSDFVDDLTSVYLGIGDTAVDSDKLGGISASLYARTSDLTKFIKHDGTVAMSNDLSIGGNKITHLTTPTAGTDGANKDYVDNAVSGSNSFKGGYDASATPVAGNPALIGPKKSGEVDVAITVGDMYKVTVGGTITCPEGGSEVFNAGDTLIASNDVPASTVKNCSDWTIIHNVVNDATPTQKGIIRIATPTEMTAGTDNTIAVTPKLFNDSINAANLLTTENKVIPDGSTTASISFSGILVAILVIDSTGIEYELKQQLSGNDVTFTSNIAIPSGLTAKAIIIASI